MNFDLTLEIDLEIEAKGILILSLSKKLREYLNAKDYGEGIQNFYIGFICIKSRLGYENWYTVRKPKYKATEKITLLNGKVKELNAIFSYDIKLDFNQFVTSSDEESRIMLASEILHSLSNLDALPKKVKNFDKERFREDMRQFFKEQNML